MNIVEPVISTNITSSSVVVDDVTINEPVIEREIKAELTVSDNIVPLDLEASGNIEVSPEVVTRISHGDYDEYQGAYEFTPTTEAQTIPTDHLVLMDNITIDPIPNNYGLITWDGVTLMVS